jgi:SAM-dependent methyltransferase
MSPVEPSSATATKAALKPVGSAELYVTVFITGAMVMTIEILGTRVIGPVFGVGLFVWSALLAVTLASLAIGYYVGGELADRGSRPTLLAKVVVASGLLLGFTPLLVRAVLLLAEGLGPRTGPLLAATLLFAPSLTALGMVSTIAVKIATRSAERAGRGVGTVYAVSTIGSLLGTLLVGFIFIPAFDANAILAGAAAVLLLLGGASWAVRGRPQALGVLLWSVLIGTGPAEQAPLGFSILDRSQSLLGKVEVILDESRGVRFMRSDHSILGARFEQDGSPGFGFVYVLEAIRFLRPHASSMLNIGLGTGAVPAELGKRGLRVDVVEIDPAVVRFAQKYFDFAATGRVYVEDARAFLQRTEQRYDFVVHDTFTGGTTPEHLLSLEVLQRIHRTLKPGGVLALNFVGYSGGPRAEASFAVARTVRAVFKHVRTYSDGPADPAHPVGNLLFFASDDALDFVIPEGTQFASAASARVQQSFGSWRVLEHVPAGPPITDARNPLGRYQLPIAEEHFSAMQKLLPTDVWIR